MNGQTYIDHYVTNVGSAILHPLEVQTFTESTRTLWKKVLFIFFSCRTNNSLFIPSLSNLWFSEKDFIKMCSSKIRWRCVRIVLSSDGTSSGTAETDIGCYGNKRIRRQMRLLCKICNLPSPRIWPLALREFTFMFSRARLVSAVQTVHRYTRVKQ